MLETALGTGREGGEAASLCPRSRVRESVLFSGVDTGFELMDSAGVGTKKKSHRRGVVIASPNW